jgi:hypothetical protein
MPAVPQAFPSAQKPPLPAEAPGQQLPAAAVRPSAGLSRPEPGPGEAAPAASAPEKPPQQAPEQPEQNAPEEQQTGHPETVAKDDWPKSPLPKKGTVDTYPPKPKPSIEF